MFFFVFCEPFLSIRQRKRDSVQTIEPHRIGIGGGGSLHTIVPRFKQVLDCEVLNKKPRLLFHWPKDIWDTDSGKDLSTAVLQACAFTTHTCGLVVDTRTLAFCPCDPTCTRNVFHAPSILAQPCSSAATAIGEGICMTPASSV